jgi:probable addiction module antidote protein
MSKKINVSELPEFDATKYLSSEEDIAAYLTAVIQENDSALLAAALWDIARARG